jgi:hypothetical protein
MAQCEKARGRRQEFPYAEWVGRIDNLEMGIERLTGAYHTHQVVEGRRLDLRVRLVIGSERTYFRIMHMSYVMLTAS